MVPDFRNNGTPCHRFDTIWKCIRLSYHPDTCLEGMLSEAFWWQLEMISLKTVIERQYSHHKMRFC